ncbi:hypothetical protein Tco_0343609 [Tanacetum coccineum]
MGDENPIRTLGYYYKPSHEGYRNTIDLPVENNVDLALYDNESWNDPRDFAKPVKAITLPQDVPSTSDRRLIKLENQVQHLMEAYLAPTQTIQVNKVSSSCEICSGPHYTQYCMKNHEQAFVDYASSRTNEVGAKRLTKDGDNFNLFPTSSFEEYTPPVTYSEEVEKTLGTLIEVEPLNETKLEEVGLNCNHNTLFSSREVPSFDGPEPQLLLSSPSLDVGLGDVIGPEPPVKPHSPDSSRMKVVDYLTIQTPPSPHVASFYPKDVYCYYYPRVEDPKRHYGFKPGLLGKSVSLGVDISNWEMFDDDWGLESKEVSPPGEELSLFDRPNEVERGRILEARRLESILQQ